MSATVWLVDLTTHTISDEEDTNSSRHNCIVFGKDTCSFRPSSPRFYLAQQALRAAGHDVGAMTEYAYEDGRNPTKGFRCLPLDEMVAEVRPATVDLFIGIVDVRSCTHDAPCSARHVQCRCPWAEVSPVDRDLCDVCEHKRGLSFAQSYPHVETVTCAHPGARPVFEDVERAGE